MSSSSRSSSRGASGRGGGTPGGNLEEDRVTSTGSDDYMFNLSQDSDNVRRWDIR